MLAEQLTAHMQSVTHGGNRPYGAGLIITDGKSIYETDPSGTMIGVHATAIGQGRQEAIDYLVENFKPDKGEGGTYKILYGALGKATNEKFNPGMTELKRI
jgi:20S proteasome alpha/beta subunit